MSQKPKKKNKTNIEEVITDKDDDYIKENYEVDYIEKTEDGEVIYVKPKKKKKRKKIKSYIGRVMDSKNHKPLPLFIFALLIALILDILRIIKNIILGLIALIIVGCIIAGLIIWNKVEPMYNFYDEFTSYIIADTDIEDFRIAESSFIYDVNGNIIAKLRADTDSEYIPYDKIPLDVMNAFIAVEDRTFWENPGIDIKGIVRVLYNYVKTSGEEAHGASTITQQLVRNIYLTSEVSIDRKLKEMLISLKISNMYSKEQIMEFYCNDICFANSFYGIQTASRGYFNKDVDELSLSQIAYLCAIPNRPEYYNPYKYPERALDRRDKILSDMLSLGYIDRMQYNEAVLEEIVIEQPETIFNDYMTTYAIDCAVQYLMKLNEFEFRYKFEDMEDYSTYQSEYNTAYEETLHKLYNGGYNIYTSLDTDIQENLQQILDEQLLFDEEVNGATGIYSLQGAITAYNNRTGKVIAVIGGRSQETDSVNYSFNRAYQSYRQPGSTIKPLVVYTPALMNGYTPTSTVYNIDVTAAKQKDVNVQSLSGTAMTLRSALEQSKNGVAWKLFDKFGADYCLSFMNQMQFSHICPDDYFDSSSLGGLTYGVSTVEMAAAYATIENHGEYRPATCLISMLDHNNNEIYKDEETIQVYSAKAADTMVDLMTGVLKSGTAAKLNWYKSSNVIAACKTGTTNASKDGWLCGFTPYYTIAVWVGYDLPREMSSLYGNTYPGQIWKASMLYLIESSDTVTEFTLADYDMYDDGDLSLVETPVIHGDLPEYAYETYMPGRDDNEELSENYYVYDFRKDRIIGEQVFAVINSINNLPQGDSQLDGLYNQGCEIIKTIYSRKYTAEMQGYLDEAYNSKR